jgi:hypothetical protein
MVGQTVAQRAFLGNETVCAKGHITGPQNLFPHHFTNAISLVFADNLLNQVESGTLWITMARVKNVVHRVPIPR